jgi:HEAT repeat protein
MPTFDETIEHLALYVEMAEGALILIAVCDDTVLRRHAVDKLRQRLSPNITLREFCYDAERLSLLEGTTETIASYDGRPAVSVTGLEALPRDKRTEAIQLLNSQRNRFGRTNIAVILWVNQAILADIATLAADFYSWSSATFFIEPPLEWNVLESMRRSYLEALVSHNEFVNLQGLAPMRGGQIVQMRMEDVFIPLRAEHVERSAEEETRTLRSLMLKQQEIDKESDLPEPMAAVERSVLETQHQAKPRRVDIPELLQERRAVILGDPGAGKTTLLRYVAYTLARSNASDTQSDIIKHIPDLAKALPVYIRISEYAQYLQGHPETQLDAFAPASCQTRQLPLTEALLNDAISRGSVIFLLDGLDEIIDTQQRREVAQRLEQFAWTHPQCRVLVTSRVVGYREAQLRGAFAQFTISPFDDREIASFAQRWYTALGTPDSAERLVQAIQASPSIRRLASSPLLLTVIALVLWRGARLPDHRVTLYRLAAETLVDQWMNHRRVSPEGWDAPETMHLLLPTVAWHLHHTTSTGLIEQEALHRLLVDVLQQHDPGISERDAHARASQFRRNVSEFSGIFLERGLDHDGRSIYGFLHLTFEEYFAALCLADKWQREGKHVLKPLLHHPRWNEIILLTAGHMSEFSLYQSTLFLRTILEMKSEYENILHRDLLMAVRCLADDIRVDAELRHTVLSQLLKIYFAPKSSPTLQDDIRQACSRLSGTIFGVELSKKLAECLANRHKRIHQAAVQALGELGAAAATPEVLTALLHAMGNPVADVRWAAAWALGQLGAATPEVLTALLHALGDSYAGVRFMAVLALLRAAAPEALTALLHILADPDAEVRGLAAMTLGQLGAAAATPEVLTALLHALGDSDAEVRREAAMALGQLGAATPEVLTALLHALGNPDTNMRQGAAMALGQLGAAAATPEVLTALLHTLGNPVAEVRWAAAMALGQLGAAAATPEVLTALLDALAMPDANMRQAAAMALGQLGAATAPPEVLTALLHALDDSDAEVRWVAAWALGQLGAAAATPEVLTALLDALGDSVADVRRAVASGLQRLSGYVRLPDRSVMVKLLLPLARSNDAESRDVGYVSLRNLLATEPVSDESHALAGLDE